jgi:hypothetical protein
MYLQMCAVCYANKTRKTVKILTVGDSKIDHFEHGAVWESSPAEELNLCTWTRKSRLGVHVIANPNQNLVLTERNGF